LIDLADQIVALGRSAQTKTKEVTVWTTSLATRSEKRFCPPPAKWEG